MVCFNYFAVYLQTMRTYGSKAYRVGKENLPDYTCANCNSKGTVSMYIFYRYYHFFGIPIMPHRRGGAIKCSNCNHVTNLKLFTADLKDIFLDKKNNYRPPVWQYLGVIGMAAAFVSLVGYRIYTHRKISFETFVSTMKPGRIFKFNITKSRYTFYKIKQVSEKKDTVYYYPCKLEFSGTEAENLEVDFDDKNLFDTVPKAYLRSKLESDFYAKKTRKFRN